MYHVRTTIDIPDDTYRALKIKAAREGTPIRQVVLRGIHRELGEAEGKPARKPFRVPVIRSARPGTLHLTNEQIDDILASS
jgi:plasmid stability protein